MSVINQKSDTDMASLYIVFENGSQLETKGYFGNLHAVEHNVFAGDSKYGNVNQLMDDFDASCIDCNAWTSGTQTVYYIQGLQDYLHPFVYEFANRIANATPTREDFEKERGIIMSEYRESFSDQQFYLNLDRVLFGDKCGYNPIGLDDDIQNITYEQFMEFKDKYHKPSKVIYTSKDYTLDESLLEFDFVDEDYFYDDIQLVGEIGTDFENAEVEIFTDYTDTDNCTMAIINKEIIEEDFPKINFINNLICGGLNSPLYLLRERDSLCYHLSLDLVPINALQGSIQFFIDTDYTNVDAVETGFFEIMENAKEYITDEMLERRKKKAIIQEKKIAIDLYQIPYFGMYPRWDDKSFLETITLEEVHSLIDKYYLDAEWLIVNDKMMY